VIAGNERVVRPRLADAEFFWTTDRKQRLEKIGASALGKVTFQNQLGSLYDKSQRVRALAVESHWRSAATDHGRPRGAAVEVRPGHLDGRRVPRASRPDGPLLRRI
jgi:glycyl-tRNA synthetase beta subunit